MENKVNVEGFERIKLKTRDDTSTSDVLNDKALDNGADPVKAREDTSLDDLVKKGVNMLEQSFSPMIAEKEPSSNSEEDKQNNTSVSPPQQSISATNRPTQGGPLGITYDFNFAMRVYVPVPEKGEGWRIRLIDQETEVVLLDRVCQDQGYASTAKHHFLQGKIIVTKIDAEGKQEDVFVHEYNAEGKEVMIVFPIGSLGDSLGWMPYAEKFRKKHNCNLTVAIGKPLIDLFEKTYPEIKFVDGEIYKQGKAPEGFYACYYLGLFFEDENNNWQPRDFRLVGLHRTAGYILGVDPTEEPPRLAVSDETRPIPEPYVVIATQASTQCKYWNNPFGWHFVVRFLKSLGYRVICIDRDPVFGRDLVWNHIPNGAEDQTGLRPLPERVRWLKHAEFFVGLSSGLAWLAWGAGIPVVLISGFTDPLTEFNTPYRVFNTHVCNGCWNDIRYLFDHNNFLYCPKHRDTPRQFECTKAISHQHVIKTILSIPGCRQKPVQQEKTELETDNVSAEPVFG